MYQKRREGLPSGNRICICFGILVLASPRASHCHGTHWNAWEKRNPRQWAGVEENGVCSLPLCVRSSPPSLLRPAVEGFSGPLLEWQGLCLPFGQWCVQARGRRGSGKITSCLVALQILVFPFSHFTTTYFSDTSLNYFMHPSSLGFLVVFSEWSRIECTVSIVLGLGTSKLYLCLFC